jgi:hypothetical protein
MLRVHALLTGCLLAACTIPAVLNGQEQRTVTPGGVSGRVIIHDSEKTVLPDEANVWILFGSTVLFGGLPEYYVDSSALHFVNQSNHFLAQDKKTMQSLLAVAKDKSKSDTQKRESLNQYQGDAIHATDQALVATMQWAQAHSNKTWQVKSLRAAPDGTWSVRDLIPGFYAVVIRARFGDFDAEWESPLIKVEPGQTLAFQDAPPRWFYQTNFR